MPELQRQPYRLSHFSIGEGSSFLRERLNTAREQGGSAFQQEPSVRPYGVQFEIADRFINYAITTAFPKRRNTADLLNETALLEPNADRALSVLDISGSVNERLTFEVVRKLVLAGISRELDERSSTYQLRNELHDVHSLLDQQLFTGKTGKTWPTTTYAVHNSRTNEILAVRDAYPLLVRPGTHIKKFEQQMRHVEDVGFVLSSVREKSRESSLAKALRRTVQQRDETGQDTIDALSAVKDAMGLQFMVKGTMGSFEPRVNVLKEKVLAALRKKYGDVMIKKDNKTNGAKEETIQSSALNCQRVLVEIPGFPIPLELMFYGEGDYINNKYHVGKKDRKTKTYPDGAAHSLYEVRRIMQILPVIYPETINDTPVAGYVGLQREAQKTLTDKSRNLRRSNKIRWYHGPQERIDSIKLRLQQRRDRKNGIFPKV